MTPDELYDLLLRHPKACQSCNIALAESGGFRFWSIGNRPSRRSDDPYFMDAIRGALVNEAGRRGWSIILEPQMSKQWEVGMYSPHDGNFTTLAYGPTIIATLLAAQEDA